MTTPHSFLYRMPRFGIDFALAFEASGGVITGRCRNLSDTGLLAVFALPLGLGMSGTIRLMPADLEIELLGRVTHADGFEAGVSFDFRSDQERQLLRAMVKAAASDAESRP